MQDNILCRKWKAPTDKLKESTVSRHDVENELDEDDEDERNTKRSLNDLKKGEMLSGNHAVNSRPYEGGSIFISQNNDQSSGGEGNLEMASPSVHNQDAHFNEVSSKYKTLLAFISGATIHSGFDESQFQNSSEQEFLYNSESN
jgi:hypothetical protein